MVQQLPVYVEIVNLLIADFMNSICYVFGSELMKHLPRIPTPSLPRYLLDFYPQSVISIINNKLNIFTILLLYFRSQLLVQLKELRIFFHPG